MVRGPMVMQPLGNSWGCITMGPRTDILGVPLTMAAACQEVDLPGGRVWGRRMARARSRGRARARAREMNLDMSRILA